MSELLARSSLGERFHSAMLTKYISFGEATRERITTLQQFFMASGTVDPTTAWHNAVITVGQSDGETFLVMGWALLMAVGAAVLMHRSTGA